MRGMKENHIRVTHLKGTVKRKNYLRASNGTLLVKPFRYLHPHHSRSFIRFWRQSSLHQSPIRIKVIWRCFDPSTLSVL